MPHTKWVEATCEELIGFRKCHHELGGYTQDEMEGAALSHAQEEHGAEYSRGQLTTSDVNAIKAAVASHFKVDEPVAEEAAAEEEPVAEEEAPEEEAV